MKRIKFYRLFTILSVPLLLTVSYIILYVEPGLSNTIPDYKYLFFWIAFVSLGGGYLNFRYFSLIQEIKDENKIRRILSRRGKYYLKKDPGEFFTDEQLQRYYKWQKIYVAFFAGAALLLFLFLNAEKMPF
ncbi:MAG: hypothetical protein PF637_07770 [Spirochaetes bacterium]|jgi:hypothetical protein|nr:hypothetical protein [Spirochaetota bacterium]